MESDQEVRHICKFCYKSFPCGRSLGGHMRSHMPSNTSAEKSKKKLSTLINYDGDGDDDDDEETRFKDAIAQNVYSLRENRKKTSKFANSNEDNYYPLEEDNMMCKECGKEFTSWKALFSHMKSHSDKFSDDSLNYISNEKAVVMVMDSQSDNEFAATPIRRQRSSRTFKRYRNATTLSITNASPCVSEIDQEQEQVALSLLMLSRDVTTQRDNWKSIHDEGKHLKCDENTLLNSFNVEIETPNSVQNCSKLEVNNSNVVSRNDEVIIETKNSQVSKDVFLEDSLLKKTKVEERIELHRIKKQKPIKRKLIVLDHIPQMSTDCSMKLVSNSPKVTEEYLGSDKNIKFECTSCNKIFHSYQALGGHRASHKKKACLGAKFDSMAMENNNDTQFSHLKLMTTSTIVTPQNLESCNATARSAITSQNLGSCSTTNNSVVTSQNLGSDGSITTSTSVANNNLIPPPRPRVFDPKFKSRKVMVSENGLKKLTNSDNVLSKKMNRLHECPLCFKVFPSGQAFGGHKRYHLLAEAKNNKQPEKESSSSAIIDQNQIPEKIKDFLDLNLPAPEQEESSSSPWWMANNHKRQPLHVGPL